MKTNQSNQIKAAQWRRRTFLKGVLVTGAVSAFAPRLLFAADAPSDKVKLACVGIGNRGGYDLGCFLEQPDVRFVAVCDVKAKRRDEVKPATPAFLVTSSNLPLPRLR